MQILLTGGAGYIGSHISLALLHAGYEIVIADNFSNASKRTIKKLNQLSNTNIPVHKIDVTDAKSLAKLFTKYSFNAVIHLAAAKSAGQSFKVPLDYYHNNLVSTLNLCRTMAEYGVFTLLFSSSAAVYGNNAQPCQETTLCNPLSPYAQSKVMAEQILTDYSNADQRWQIFSLRYFNPAGADASGMFGELLDSPSLFNHIASQVLYAERDLLIFGDDYPNKDGTAIRDYIHVSDLAAAHAAILTQLSSNDSGFTIVNLGSGKGITVREVITAFEQASTRNIPCRVMPQRAGDSGFSVADMERCYKKLTWRPQLGLRDMVNDTLRWVEQRNTEIPPPLYPKG